MMMMMATFPLRGGSSDGGNIAMHGCPTHGWAWGIGVMHLLLKRLDVGHKTMMIDKTLSFLFLGICCVR